MENELVLKTIGFIEDKAILSEGDLSIVKKCLPIMEINTNVANQDFYDEYVLCDKDFPTQDSKFYQAVRELNVRMFTFLDTILSYQELELDLEAHQEEQAKGLYKTHIEEKKHEITIHKLQLKIASVRNTLNSTYKEITIWKALMEKYCHAGLKDFGTARQEEMEEKKAMLQFMCDKYGMKMTESQIALFLKKNRG